MRMEASEQAAFIREHLGPAFAARGLSTRILAWDHNWDEPDYPIAVLDDTGAKAYLAGSAFHCYAGDSTAQERVHSAHPDRGIWFTECSGGSWAPDYAANLRWNARALLIGALRRHARSLLLWNLALDAQGGPHTGGCNGCRGVVTVDGGSFRLEVEYDVLGHLSKFVLPAARRVASTSLDGSIETVAFKNSDGTTVLVAFNATSAAQEFAVGATGLAFTYTLPSGALATFRW
jgi:glucosylceramidase